MALQITIVGGLPDNPEREVLLEQLRVRTEQEIEWEWIKAEPPHWNIPPKPLNKLLGLFRNVRSSSVLPIVVKLPHLHGRDQSKVYAAISDPKLVPHGINGIDELIGWLTSAEAGLIPRINWYGTLSIAAFAALLSKLIKNKSWNKDTQGHEWTKEADLLGQSPVQRPGFDEVRKEAEELLRRGNGVFFLSKGGQHGKTPKEWCIRLEYVPLVKRVVLARNFAEISEVSSLESIARRFAREEDPRYRIDGEIVTERVLHICRE